LYKCIAELKRLAGGIYLLLVINYWKPALTGLFFTKTGYWLSSFFQYWVAVIIFPFFTRWPVTYAPSSTSLTVTKPVLMKIRLHEIEFGAGNTDKSKGFYQAILGLDPVIDQDQLKVFNSGVAGVDFNVSEHQPAKTVTTSFLTDDLQKLIDRLQLTGVLFEGPSTSHFGMLSISLQDPDGNCIKINQPTKESPSWLKV